MTERELDVITLFIHYLEGRMVGDVPELSHFESTQLTSDVGEDGPPITSMVYRSGLVEIIDGGIASLQDRGLKPYPHTHLTTTHALSLTRALAAFHAQTSIIPDLNTMIIRNKESLIQESDNGNTEIDDCDNASVYKDKWTMDITQVEQVQSCLSILCNRLRCRGHNPRTVQRLEALNSDLPTLTQFLQFASAMQTQRVKSVGPIGIGDIWINSEDEEEEIVAIRLRGGTKLQSPLLRDAAWLWLTLLSPETLRDRYMELCDEYCMQHNNSLRRVQPDTLEEELSFFNVMQDLGENFLHAFLTIVHKFVLSGTWFMDRQLHTQDGLQDLADVISFLVDNGIVGSIFVM